MKRYEPKIGTKGPMKSGGTGGGLSKTAVAKEMAPKPVVKSKATGLPKASDTKRNAKAMKEMY